MEQKGSTSLNNWTQVWQPQDLWGEEVGRQLAGALEGRLAAGRDGEARARDTASRLAKLNALMRGEPDPGRVEDLKKEAQAFLDAIPADEPPSEDFAVPALAPRLPSAQSCVEGYGPYNVWGEENGGSIHSVPLTSPISLHPQQVFAEGQGEQTVGAGCWFTVGSSGTGTLGARLAFNAHDYVSGAFGYAEGSIRFGLSVWGQREGRWVDRGGVVQEISHVHYLAFEHFDANTNGRLTFSCPFDAVAGGAYYCAARVSITALAYGLLSAASVEVAAIMAPLMVCI